MSINYNPKIVTDGLVLYLDAANSRSIKKRSSNLLNWDSWTVGTGSVTGYTVNGTVDENRRILDTNPFGHSDVVWDTPSNDVDSGADGGWGGSNIDIDPTKMYRFSTWVRRKVLGNGIFYLGCYGFDSVGANVGVLYRSNGTVDTNPYFSATGWWGSATTWYLVVGHVWPVGSGTGAMHVDSAIYNTSGTKVATTQDFVWQSTTVKTTHRSYLYYSTDPTTNQQWYHPRVDLCNGSEPTISELLNNIENTWYDLSGNGNNGILTNGPNYTAVNNGSLVFDGTDDMVTFNNPLNQSNTLQVWSIISWINITDKVSQALIIGLNSGCFVCFSQGNNSLMYLNSGVDDYYIYGGDLGNIGWTMVSFRFRNSDGTRRIYKNLTDISTSGPNNTSTPSGLNSTFYLGSGLQGNVSQLMIYNRYIENFELSQNFNATRGRYGI